MALTAVQRFRKFDGRERVFPKVAPNLLHKANVSGWMAGIMRSDLYERMLKKIPEGMIIPNCHFKRYEESDEEIKLFFEMEKRILLIYLLVLMESIQKYDSSFGGTPN